MDALTKYWMLGQSWGNSLGQKLKLQPLDQFLLLQRTALNLEGAESALVFLKRSGCHALLNLVG